MSDGGGWGMAVPELLLWCEKCERAAAHLRAQEPNHDGRFYVTVECGSCGHSMTVRDDFERRRPPWERDPDDDEEPDEYDPA
jgi:hypothetical protein